MNQPAGHLEHGESLLQAIEREVLEETAFIFKAEFLLGVYRWLGPEKQTYLRFCFAGTVQEQIKQQLDADILEAVWMDIESIRQENIRSPLVLQCFNDYLGGKRYPLTILNELV